ncbi:MAG: hypothetical protein PHY14_00275 [Candidatus Gracilibacteria bacterium]|nr:hypothetical protein [Candidatus Gracilibacteria bacterium]
MISPVLSSRKGFSILVALGTIGVLLIIMTSLASIYINELKLSRFQYNDIISYAQADGAFEYAMLKVKNHREGFQDTMTNTDPDAKMFVGNTPRTLGTQVQYQIASQSKDKTFTLSGSSHLILPLFAGTGNIITGASRSLDPRNNSMTEGISTLSLTSTGDISALSWSIVAMSGSENISLAGTGTIVTDTIGTVRLRGMDCYDSEGVKGMCGDGVHGIEYGGDSIEYFYDSSVKVSDFLGNPVYKDPYLLIFNNSSTPSSFTIQSNNPFTLPVLKVLTEAKKGNSMQSVEFSEDKSKYYDAIRYGIYNR